METIPIIKATSHLTVAPPTNSTPRITVPTPPTPIAASGLARCCPRCTHLRSGVLIFMTIISVAGLAATLTASNLANRELYAGAFAILALGCLYFAKDALDKEKQLSNIVADRLLAQAQLQNTEIQLSGTQKRLAETEKELDEERRELEKVTKAFVEEREKLTKICEVLGVQTINYGAQNERFTNNNTTLEISIRKIEEIIEKKS